MSSSSTLGSKLIEEFGGLSAKQADQLQHDPTLLSKCVEICTVYNLGASELASKWEAFLINNKKEADVSLNDKTLEKFKTSLSQTQQFVKKSRTTSRVYDKNTLSEITNIYGVYDEHVNAKQFMMDIDKEDRKSTTEMDLDDTVTNKTQARVEVSHNSHLEQSRQGSQAVTIEPQSKLHSYRYMNDKIIKKSEALEARIETLANSIVGHHKLETPSIFHVPSQEGIIAVGRICSESEGKLNDATPAFLESTRANGTKVRVKLTLQIAEGYSIFPGQVVALEGKNPTGKVLVVTKVYEGAPLPTYSTPQLDEPISLMIASGPWYDNSINFNFSMLRRFVKEVQRSPPDVLILIGPFVDSQHPAVDNGMLETSFEEQMKAIMQLLRTEISSTVQIVIVPSLRDAHHEFVFPQPAFPKESDQPTNIHLVPNPCVLSVNGVYFGITSNDIIRYLSAEEVSKSKPGPTSDRMHKLCEHLVNQQSFYPLFPTDINTNLDSANFSQLQFRFTPHLLVVPSDLQHFIKNVNDVLCLNPGRASKGKGTFCRATVHPSTTEAQKIVDRTRVDIVRL